MLLHKCHINITLTAFKCRIFSKSDLAVDGLPFNIPFRVRCFIFISIFFLFTQFVCFAGYVSALCVHVFHSLSLSLHAKYTEAYGCVRMPFECQIKGISRHSLTVGCSATVSCVFFFSLSLFLSLSVSVKVKFNWVFVRLMF